MNLAEEQDHTYSVVNCMAKQWQDHISNGNALVLPDRMCGVTAFWAMTQFILHGKSMNGLQSGS